MPIPLIVILILRDPSKIGIGTVNSWIGFYGSYFGAVLSGIVTLVIIRIHLGNETNKKNKEDSEFLRTLSNSYFKTIKFILEKAIEKISKEDLYIPKVNLFYDEILFAKLLSLKLEYSKKYEFIYVFYNIKSLVDLQQNNDIMRNQQNYLMVSKNIDIINTKILADALKSAPDKVEKILKTVKEIIENEVYPTLKGEVDSFKSFAANTIEQIDKIEKKLQGKRINHSETILS